MMSPVIRIMNEYRMLVVKMMEDQVQVDSTRQASSTSSTSRL
jgi:hypothetical protein